MYDLHRFLEWQFTGSIKSNAVYQEATILVGYPSLIFVFVSFDSLRPINNITIKPFMDDKRIIRFSHEYKDL